MRDESQRRSDMTTACVHIFSRKNVRNQFNRFSLLWNSIPLPALISAAANALPAKNIFFLSLSLSVAELKPMKNNAPLTML
jgi:hypothetical protein